MNSARRLSYTAGDLLLASRRARGRVRLRAGVVKVTAWLLLASWPPFKACAVVVLLFSSPLFSRRRRHSSVELASPPQRKPASANLAIASLVPCATSPPALVA